MRWLIVSVAAAAAFALPASAASIDPKLLVLTRFDVPDRYFFDDDNSVLITRAMLEQTSGSPSTRRLLRAGYVTGYFARYLNSDPPHWRYVDSGVYVSGSEPERRPSSPGCSRTGSPRPAGVGRGSHSATIRGSTPPPTRTTEPPSSGARAASSRGSAVVR